MICGGLDGRWAGGLLTAAVGVAAVADGGTTVSVVTAAGTTTAAAVAGGDLSSSDGAAVMGGFFSGIFLGGGGLFAGYLGGPGAGWSWGWGLLHPSAESTSSFASGFFCSASSLTFTSLATGGDDGVDGSCSLRFFGCGGRLPSPLPAIGGAGGLVGLTGEVTAAAAVVVGVGGPGLLGCGGAGFLGADAGGGLAGPGVGPGAVGGGG